MHDWTRIEPNEFHTFRGRWTFAVCDALNGGLLPADYYAMADFSLRTVVPDVLTLRRPAAVSPAPAAAAPPRAWSDQAVMRKPRTRTRRVAVRTTRDRAVVAIVEIVSPGNKAKRSDLRAFVDKAVGALDAGVHVLVIDPFPPGPHDPTGIHGAVWKAATGRKFTPPAGKPLTLASYVARGGDDLAAVVEPVAVGDVLPGMPLYLTADTYVNVPLEATYQVAWAAFPAAVRALVAP